MEVSPLLACCVLKWSDITKSNAVVIAAAVITTHHKSALRFRYKLRYLLICAVVTAAVITAAVIIAISLYLRSRQRTHFHAPTIQTNSFCFGENITFFPFPMSIFKFIFILSRNPFDQDIVSQANVK